jgi:hypothetical protein
MKTFNGKPFLIIDSQSYDQDQADCLLGLFDIQNQGSVTDILDKNSCNRLREFLAGFCQTDIDHFRVFADSSMSTFDMMNPEFLQLIYDTVSEFDVEIYHG